MKISVYYIGRNEDNNLQKANVIFEKRIQHYVPFKMMSLGKPRISGIQPAIKHKDSEGRLILKGLSRNDMPVLLDIKGRQMSSEAFSEFIQQFMNRGIRHLVFIIGGSYGFSDAVYKAVPDMVSLSQMTLSHQLARLVFLEQLYRAMTILHGESYHHN